MLPALFEGHIISGTDPAHPQRQSKPAPDAYVAAAAYYKANPAECLAIEDSAIGVKAAIAAGFTCWGYTGLSQVPKPIEELLNAGATRTFAHWDEFII
jgi:beta-phosphoglucomutase-like phosphatase (HAD superfamily)